MITTVIDTGHASLASALATRQQKNIAVAIGIVALAAFLLIVPFVRVHLVEMPAFIPSYEAALFFIDLITAVLLFDQARRLKSLSLVVLAAGYLFDAFIIIPHALSFPGAFAATGLLGAGPQTTAWLYVFWHGGFPLFVIGYALLRRREAHGDMSPASGTTIGIAVAAAAALAILCAILTTWQHDRLPVVMQGRDYSLLVSKGISPAVWGVTLIAMLMLWQREQRVVDLWLMLVMWIWLFDIALAAVIGSQRFDLGFYAGRIFGLIASSFLLATLIVEMAKIYASALGAAARAEHKLVVLGRLRERRMMDRRRGEGATTNTYIQRENIARYQSLLEQADLDEAQRRAIEKLLSEEEAKLRAGGSLH